MSSELPVTMHEIEFLKETLKAQQELLQKLYNELDAERESSATAADETLSMILRLQGEKAALEMEASQYKRIAEEKICHAQEMLDVFEEVVYQKEIQISSLEFQVQSSKFKLSSLGCDDVDCEGSIGTFRRVNSLPPPVNKALSRRASTDGARTETSSPRARGDFSLYWEELKKFLSSPVESTCSMHNSLPDKSEDECCEKVVNVEVCGESEFSSSVQDIFEVPQCYDDCNRISSDKEVEAKIGPWSSRYGVVEFEVEQLNQRLKKLEVERSVSRVSKEIGDEEMKVLREMLEKVEAMQSEIMSWSTKKRCSPEKRSFGCFSFKEVLQCFLP